MSSERCTEVSLSCIREFLNRKVAYSPMPALRAEKQGSFVFAIPSSPRPHTHTHTHTHVFPLLRDRSSLQLRCMRLAELLATCVAPALNMPLCGRWRSCYPRPPLPLPVQCHLTRSHGHVLEQGFKSTLACLEEEAPRNASSISSRAKLVKVRAPQEPFAFGDLSS